MSGCINRVTLIGNVGATPEVKELPSGGRAANVRLATNEYWKDASGQKQERTEWHSLSMYGKLADLTERYVNKGDKIVVEGSIRTRSWEKNGEKRYATEITVRDMTFLGSRSDGDKYTAPKSSPAAKVATKPSPVSDTDDLPF